MASSKKRRKQAKLTRQDLAGGRPAIHADGDRRRRGGMTADQAVKNKRAMQQFPGVLPPDEPPGSVGQA